jgi:hypothetical protein
MHKDKFVTNYFNKVISNKLIFVHLLVNDNQLTPTCFGAEAPSPGITAHDVNRHWTWSRTRQTRQTCQ